MTVKSYYLEFIAVLFCNYSCCVDILGNCYSSQKRGENARKLLLKSNYIHGESDKACAVVQSALRKEVALYGGHGEESRASRLCFLQKTYAPLCGLLVVYNDILQCAAEGCFNC